MTSAEPFKLVSRRLGCLPDIVSGLTGCRRRVPHLQRLLTHIEDELAALEKATIT